MLRLPIFLILTSLTFSGTVAAEPGQAAKAYQVLNERCFRCHGGGSRNADLNVLDRESLTRPRGSGDATVRFVVPGKSDASGLWSVIEGDYMPLAGSPEAAAMTAAERTLLKSWIDAGAPFPERRVVTFLDEKQVLTALRDDLLKTRADDRRYLRYYTFHHLQNNPSVTEQNLRTYQGALSKVINSLSWERAIALPRVVDGTGGTVLAIDLRQTGWSLEQWIAVLKRYPYGLKYSDSHDAALAELSQTVLQLTGGDLPYVRGDWFVADASRPPLYHTLLKIPDRLSHLERQLGIDSEANIRNGRAARAGFATSGVSRQNRLVERHDAPNTPYYWISYDFKPRKSRGDLVRFPLGPKFPGNEHARHAFEHDGGEVIFSLPNGMQAYMLVTGEGNRIDEGPVDVVFDKSALLGTPAIVNGISCMHCHRHGMITAFRDEIRGADAAASDVRRKIEELYPPASTMQQHLQQDRDIFVRALDRAVGPFVRVGDEKSLPIDSDRFPEPAGHVAQLYARDLGPREAALELGFASVEAMQERIRANRSLLKMGLGTLAQDPPGTIKREKWETLEGTSFFQDVAVELRLGTPVRH